MSARASGCVCARAITSSLPSAAPRLSVLTKYCEPMAFHRAAWPRGPGVDGHDSHGQPQCLHRAGEDGAAAALGGWAAVRPSVAGCCLERGWAGVYVCVCVENMGRTDLRLVISATAKCTPSHAHTGTCTVAPTHAHNLHMQSNTHAHMHTYARKHSRPSTLLRFRTALCVRTP